MHLCLQADKSLGCADSVPPLSTYALDAPSRASAAFDADALARLREGAAPVEDGGPADAYLLARAAIEPSTCAPAASSSGVRQPHGAPTQRHS